MFAEETGPRRVPLALFGELLARNAFAVRVFGMSNGFRWSPGFTSVRVYKLSFVPQQR